MALGKMWWRRYSMCCLVSSRGTKTLVSYTEGSTWSSMARVQADGKKTFFLAVQKNIGMSCAPQKHSFLSFLFGFLILPALCIRQSDLAACFSGMVLALYSLFQASVRSYLNQRCSVWEKGFEDVFLVEDRAVWGGGLVFKRQFLASLQKWHADKSVISEFLLKFGLELEELASKGLDILSDLFLLLKLIQNENKVVGLYSKAIRIQFLLVLCF